MARVLFLLASIVLFSGNNIFATTPNPYRNDGMLNIKHLTVEQGLSHNKVIFIFRDSLGFLWLGTGNGFNRYDGYQFKSYYFNPIENPYSPWISSMVEGRDGNFWLGTNTVGLARLNIHTGNYTLFSHNPDDPDSLCSNNVRAIHFSRGQGKNMLWVGTPSGLSRLILPNKPGGNVHIKNYHHNPANSSSLAHDNVTTILETRKGNTVFIWIGTADGLSLLKLEHGDKIEPGDGGATFVNIGSQPDNPDTLSHPTVRALCQSTIAADASASSPTIWVGTSSGLNRLHLDSRGIPRIIHYKNDPAVPSSLSHNYVTSLVEDTFNADPSEPLLWIGTQEGGLNLLNIKKGIFKHYINDANDSSSLSDIWIQSLYLDPTGILWVGTEYRGANKVIYGKNKLEFLHYRDRPQDPGDLSSNSVRSIVEDPGDPNLLWIGTFDGGLNLLNRKTGRAKHFNYRPGNPKGISNDRVYNVFFDRSGTLWAGTYVALDKMNPDRGFSHYLNGPDTPLGRGVRHIYQDRTGKLWIATVGEGMYRFDPVDKSVKSYRYDPSSPNSISSNYLYITIGTIENGKEILWIGAFDGGLNRLDPETGRFTSYRHNPRDPHSISNDRVTNIYAPPNHPGILWIATYGGGLNRFHIRTQRFINFKEKDNLRDHCIYGILPDDNGNLWLSTNFGILKFNISRQTFNAFNATDGLGGNEFNGGAYYRNEKGELFFGGIHGLNIFQPEKLKRNNTIPPMVLTVAKNFKDNFITGSNTPPRTIRLDHRDRVVSFEFAALDFINPAKNKYAYKLEGLENDWIYTTDRRVVNYTNLAPGNYRFRVKGSNSDDTWNEKGITLGVQVIPSLTQTTWFRISIFASALFSLIFMYRVWSMSRQRRTLREKVEERTRELKNATEQAQRMAYEAKEANEAKSWFLANMSHEIRTPMAGIIGLTSLLLDSPHSVEQEQQLNMVNQSANHLLGVLNDILDISKIEAGQLQLNPVSFNPAATMKVIEGIVSQQVREKGLSYQWRIHGSMSATVIGDRLRLKQVLLNLVGNAIKFTEKGGIQVDLYPGPEDTYHFAVTDTGVGIPPEKAEHIFERFTQADNTVTRKYGGSGLGLTICRQLVGLMGGGIWFQNNPEGGSVFHFTVKMPADSDIETGPADSLKHKEEEDKAQLIQSLKEFNQPNGREGEEIRLLLAEDNPINQKLAKSMIDKTGIPLDIVPDGGAAVRAVKEYNYDLILMDIQMPEMDGLSATGIIRRELGIKNIPIIAMTAHAMKEDREKCFQAGMNDYITKPFKPNELYSALLKHLKT